MKDILTIQELMAWCERDGFFPPLEPFDLGDIPEELRPLAPYARVWGQLDEDLRAEVKDSTPAGLRRHFLSVVGGFGFVEMLDFWLGGPAADGPSYSDGYLAFSALNLTFAEML